MDRLFVGLTRPAMKWGVPMDAIILGGLVASVALIATGNPLYLLLYIPIHSFMFVLCLKEPNITRLAMLWVMTKLRSNLRHGIGAATASPALNTQNKTRFRK